MFKYVFTACVVFTLLLQANDVILDDEVIINDEMFINDECDGIYDKCVMECEDKDSENEKCYVKCEELYEECLLKKRPIIMDTLLVRR